MLGLSGVARRQINIEFPLLPSLLSSLGEIEDKLEVERGGEWSVVRQLDCRRQCGNQLSSDPPRGSQHGALALPRTSPLPPSLPPSLSNGGWS